MPTARTIRRTSRSSSNRSARGEAELVIASRTRGGSDELHGTAEQLLRYIGSQLIMLAINYRWQVRLTDSQNGFRALRRDVARALRLTSNLTTIEQEMLMRALKCGCRVVEIPSHEFERRWGVSKVSVWRSVVGLPLVADAQHRVKACARSSRRAMSCNLLGVN